MDLLQGSYMHEYFARQNAFYEAGKTFLLFEKEAMPAS
jgi:hypothetical protein